MFKYSNVHLSGHKDDEMISAEDYPTNASHSRFPIMVRCEECKKLVMTDIEYENGTAAKLWCCLLLPVFATGICCLCLNSCKDVRHRCSECGK